MKQKSPAAKPLRNLLPYLKPYRLQLSLGPLFKLIEAIIELLIPLIMARMIDIGVAGQDQHYLWSHGLLLLGLVVIGLLFSLCCQYMASVASQGVGTRLRTAVYEQILRLPKAQLQTIGSASLINRITGDINQIQLAVAMTIRLLSRAPFLAIGGMIMSFIIEPRLAVILLLTVPVAALLLYLIMRATVRVFKLAQRQTDKVVTLIRDNISGARVIRSLAKEPHEQAYFGANNDKLNHFLTRAGQISSLMNPLTSLLFNGGIVFVIWQSGALVDTGQLHQGDVLALANYLGQIVLAMMVVANLVILFPRAYASSGRVTEVLNLQPDSGSADQGNALKPATPVPAGLAFNQVSLTYPANREPSLTQISFRLRPGEQLGVIGATGSGKSTLIAALLREYALSQGDITINGLSIRQAPVAAWHRQIAWVPQKAVLFSGSLRSNLLWGLPPDVQPDETAIWSVLQDAQAADFVRLLPGGLDAAVERGGQNFSGGQRQRLTIARALLKQASIYVFDDSSSALDYATDLALRRAVRRRTRQACVIIISQRVYQVRDTEQILVLENGRMAGLGTHQTLLQHCPLYQDIARSQEAAAQ
ncbi:MAG: ABC transporter ATP-binding protein [Oscillospiraceae bacterium]|nr:ABC transporter ATP-binding protein [Oscillospiraceae bacterium]MDD4367482.1 ABC transporter ATP-binding protein [Oscillospiraceae bacterium]